MLLADPAYTVPPPGPPGPVGTLPWLRATVSRFSEGDVHTRRRALVEDLLASLDPAELHDAARDAARAASQESADATARGMTQPRHRAARGELAAADAPAGGEPAGAMARGTAQPRRPAAHGEPDREAMRGGVRGTAADATASASASVELPYVPVAVLAEALGAREVRVAVEAVRTVAAAYHPGTDAGGADEALARLLELLPAAEPERAAQQVALLVQACEATAALVRGALERPLEVVLRETPPVPAIKRLSPDGELVVVPLDGHPFGAGPRACPGEAHARALAAGVIDGVRLAGAPGAATGGASEGPRSAGDAGAGEGARRAGNTGAATAGAVAVEGARRAGDAGAGEGARRADNAGAATAGAVAVEGARRAGDAGAGQEAPCADNAGAATAGVVDGARRAGHTGAVEGARCAGRGSAEAGAR